MTNAAMIAVGVIVGVVGLACVMAILFGLCGGVLFVATRVNQEDINRPLDPEGTGVPPEPAPVMAEVVTEPVTANAEPVTVTASAV